MLMILGIELVNYKRIYNGTGKKKLDLDFYSPGCKIVRITGINGSGKSTLLRALTPFPDPPSEFIDGNGEKKIVIQSDDNTRYCITYVCNNYKTSASILKYNNDADFSIQLNPSGNVKSAKEIIYNLFNLDPNFEVLTMMNGYDRKSLAHMRPAERKQFISTLLSNLEVYNNLYKTLSKRSSIFKAMINDLSAKIASIGNTPDAITTAIANYNTQLECLEKEKESILKKLLLIDLTDAEIEQNQKIKHTIEILEGETLKKINSLVKVEENWDNLIASFDYKLFNINSIILDNDVVLIQDICKNTELEINKLTTDIENDTKEIKQEKDKRDMLSDREHFIKSMSEYQEFLIYSSEETKEKLEAAKKVCKAFKENRNQFSYEEVSAVYNSNFKIFYTQFQRILAMMNEENNLELEFRKTDDCKWLISDRGTYFQDEILRWKRMKYEELSPETKDDIIPILEDVDLTIMNMNKLKLLYKYSKQLRDLVSDYHYSKDFLDKIGIVFNVEGRYIGSFNYTACSYLLDDITNYMIAKEFVDECERFYHSDKSKRITALYLELDSIKKEYQIINSKIEELKTKISQNSEKLKQLKDISSKLIQLRDTIVKYYDLKNSIYIDKAELDKLKASYVDTTDCSFYKDKLEKVEESIKATHNLLYKYRYSLDLMNEYMLELSEFNDKSRYIEILRKHCNPSTGIQMIFVDLYMNQILNTVNYILKNFFNGQFMLQPFVINENEFRIPVQGDGLLIDDISSMSASQIAIINMALSFALLSSSSSKYNIIRLDEIDSSLDRNNRAMFPNMITTIMDLLKSDQCFLVSHNEEFSGEGFKIISLS